MSYNSPTLTFLGTLIGGGYYTAMNLDNHFFRGVALTFVTGLILGALYGIYLAFKSYNQQFFWAVYTILFIEVMYFIGFWAKRLLSDE